MSSVNKIGDQVIADDSIQRLGFHARTSETAPLHAQVRRHFMWLDSWLLQNVPNGRELAEARTNLQTASMFANAAVACNLAPVVHDDGIFDEGDGLLD